MKKLIIAVAAMALCLGFGNLSASSQDAAPQEAPPPAVQEVAPPEQDVAPPARQTQICQLKKKRQGKRARTCAPKPQVAKTRTIIHHETVYVHHRKDIVVHHPPTVRVIAPPPCTGRSRCGMQPRSSTCGYNGGCGGDDRSRSSGRPVGKQQVGWRPTVDCEGMGGKRTVNPNTGRPSCLVP